MNYKKKGFTLIELLAVIIILAIIALIATPVVLKVVDNAKESARKSSVTGYADAIRLAINESMFENKGLTPTIDSTFLSNITYQGESVSCNNVVSSNSYGVILHKCNVGSNTNLYCYLSGKVYSCDDTYYTNIYNNLDNSSESTEYIDNSGANRPVLYTNMIPVRYDGTNWIYADIHNKWYDYDLKEWANAVILNSGITKNVGDTIDVSTEVSQMYVWIPRYKYTIFNGNNGSTAAQEINVVLESGTNSTGTISCTDAVAGSGTSSETCTDTTNGSVTNGTSTYTHPSFSFGTSSLTGFWVGKFETSNITSCTAINNSVGTDCDLTTLGIQIKPNVLSWRGARVSTFFTSIKSIASQYSINADSHMMRNMEWGAVAYLTLSKYGLSTTNIGININSNYTTGCGAAAGSSQNTSCYKYDTTNGKMASTTGNITGIYDMSGGAYEYVMGCMTDSSGMFYSGGAGFLSILGSNYYDLYTYGIESIPQSRGKLGDATKETLVNYGTVSGGWYSDYASFVKSTKNWFIRGGYYGDASLGGIFYTYGDDGHADTTYGARVVFVKAD